MNITINKDFLQESVGQDSLFQVHMIIEINNAILSYVAPWLGTITVVTNHIVVLLSIAIYMKTKKKNHKPAFVFIGFLAFIDIVIGGWVRYSEQNIFFIY